MKKGAFQNTGEQLPIVSEIPQKINTSHLSPETSRSEAIEALIQQNDDLMARLSVSLRRISNLEEGLNIANQSNEKLNFHYNSLKDQVLILKQKAQAISQRREGHENQFKSLQDKIKHLEEELRLSEVRYTELIHSKELKQNLLVEKIDEHARRLSRHLNYRRRNQQAAAHLRKKWQQANLDIREQKSVIEHNLTQEIEQVKTELKRELLETKQTLTKEKVDIESQLLGEVEVLGGQNERIQKKLDTTEQTLSDLRIKLAESTSYIQEQNKQQQSEVETLREDYEARIKKLNLSHNNEVEELKNGFEDRIKKQGEEIISLQREQQKVVDKCTDLESVYEDNVLLKNKIVFTERKRDEVKNKLQDEIELLQKNLAHYRADSKSKSSELESIRTTSEQHLSELKSLQQNKLDLADQVENLQALWRENQNQLEKELEKNKSLQKLNQQLSRNLNGAKSEMQEMKNRMEESNFVMSKKLKEMQQNKDTVKSIQSIKSGLGQEDMHPQLMGKIDSLIAEIQSGFTKKL